MLYLKGRGVAQDYVQARAWLQKAADQGYASAITNLKEAASALAPPTKGDRQALFA